MCAIACGNEKKLREVNGGMNKGRRDRKKEIDKGNIRRKIST